MDMAEVVGSYVRLSDSNFTRISVHEGRGGSGGALYATEYEFA